MYELLVYAHIIGAAVWVGSSLFIYISATRERHAHGDAGRGRYLSSLEWTGTRVFVPASLLVLITGISMVLIQDSWRFSQMWVYLALGLFVVSAIANGVFGEKIAAQVRAASESGSAESAEFSALTNKYWRFLQFDVLIVLGILALMVFKPGL